MILYLYMDSIEIPDSSY